jgi:ankyrin repeat protein
VLAGRFGAFGKDLAQIAMSKRMGAAAKTPAPPAPEPLAKARPEVPAEKPAASAASTVAAPAEPVGYRRPANIRNLYSRYNDLKTATVMGDGAAVKELLDDGKDPNARQSDGITPLMIAADRNDLVIATMLLAKGADPNLRAAGGVNALSIAKARGVAGVPMAQLLQRSGARE